MARKNQPRARRASHKPGWQPRTKQAQPNKARSKNLKTQNQSLRQNNQKLKLGVVASIIVNLLLVGVVGVLTIDPNQTEEAPPNVKGLPATLDPANFQGETRRAYQVAKDIPAVLDGIFCYCYCGENHGHRSLLDCYVTEHATTCDTCQGEALRAQELWDEGLSIQKISDKIDEEYGGESLDRG